MNAPLVGRCHVKNCATTTSISVRIAVVEKPNVDVVISVIVSAVAVVELIGDHFAAATDILDANLIGVALSTLHSE